MITFNREYKEVKASYGDFQKLPAGGYVVTITDVELITKDKPYLSCTFDIAEGEYKGFYSDEWGKEHPYAHQFRQYLTEASQGAFKGFLKAIDESNGTSFVKKSEDKLKLDEREIIGKTVGLLIGYKERANDRGEVRQYIDARGTRSAAAIREGRFKVPELKTLEGAASAPAYESPVDGFMAVNDNDLPFF